MKLLVLSLLALFMFSFSGCRTPDYQAKAVKKASAYALENLPELSEKGKHAIKFTQPKVYQTRVIAREGVQFSSKKDIVQTCMMWQHPDDEGMSIVVTGVSEKRLDDWYPNRVIIKKYEKVEQEIKDEK